MGDRGIVDTFRYHAFQNISRININEKRKLRAARETHPTQRITFQFSIIQFRGECYGLVKCFLEYDVYIKMEHDIRLFHILVRDSFPLSHRCVSEVSGL